MRIFSILVLSIIISGCGGGKSSEVSEREIYGQKRADCKTTKMTDQGANVMQCSQIRADDKELENLNNNSDPFDEKPRKSGQFVDPSPY